MLRWITLTFFLSVLPHTPCGHFHDIPIVTSEHYLNNETRFFNESNGHTYNPNGPLVHCSYLPYHSIWCEPPVDLSDMEGQLKVPTHGCRTWGGREAQHVELTKIVCHALVDIECYGNRTFYIDGYPCLRFEGHYFVTTFIYSVLLGFFGVDRLCLGYVGSGTWMLPAVLVVLVSVPAGMLETQPSQMDSEPTQQQQQRWYEEDQQFMERYPNGIPLAEMIPFYEAVERGDPMKLDWICPGRINLASRATPTTTMVPPVSTPNVAVTEVPGSSSKLAEFDFDESNPQPVFSTTGPNAPLAGISRVVGGPARNPPRQPRVANMEKILHDLFRTRKGGPGSTGAIVSDAQQQPHTTPISNNSDMIQSAEGTDLPMDEGVQNTLGSTPGTPTAAPLQPALDSTTAEEGLTETMVVDTINPSDGVIASNEPVSSMNTDSPSSTSITPAVKDNFLAPQTVVLHDEPVEPCQPMISVPMEACPLAEAVAPIVPVESIPTELPIQLAETQIID